MNATVKRMPKHDEIADSLTRDILQGQYRTGERLPSERDLAARFAANRGAVREAMKKLEQLGIAEIQPGGARVTPLNQASLDVIGCLLSLGDVPQPDLVDQILVVIASLVQTAALNAVRKADDQELRELRQLVRPLHESELDPEAHMQARVDMMHSIMAASGNLPVQLIAHALLQFMPAMTPLDGLAEVDRASHRRLAKALDEAMEHRDLDQIARVFNELSELNRQQARGAFDAYRAMQTRSFKEVATS
ncbi:MAG: GntR family transcriptional regulator [Pseudomonadales bacterium]|nr:FadR family transcriptional regulator [Pseudomonadales bacterium]